MEKAWKLKGERSKLKGGCLKRKEEENDKSFRNNSGNFSRWTGDTATPHSFRQAEGSRGSSWPTFLDISV